MSDKDLILIDADVVIHLIKAEVTSLLNQLFPDRVRILDIVLNELLNNRTVKAVIPNLITFKILKEIPFPTTSNSSLFHEYISLKSQINGDGERASLLYCKYHKHIIASSNTSDIIPYCQQYSIIYLTTLDIFSIALKRGIYTATEINGFIQTILRKGSFLCCDTIEKHLNNHFDNDKLLI